MPNPQHTFFALAVLVIVLLAFAVVAASSTLLATDKQRQSVHTRPPVVQKELLCAHKDAAAAGLLSVHGRDIVLLTCTVNVHAVNTLAQTDPKVRLQMYRTSVWWWLAQTNFAIVVVENSGVLLTMDKLNIPHTLQAACKDRFNACTFDEATHGPAAHLRSDDSKGRHELFAIEYAMAHAPLLQQAHAPQFVIKVTGRYYIPMLESALAEALDRAKHVAVRQSRADRCELVGARMDWAARVFATHPPAAWYVEHEYQRRLAAIQPQSQVCVLPLLPIPPTVQGSQGNVNYHI